MSDDPAYMRSCAGKCCRSCDAQGLLPVLDLGPTPLTAAFVRPEDVGKPEQRIPLGVAFCPQCALVQILDEAPPEQIFGRDYPYYSSFSDALLRHARDYAFDLVESRGLNADSFVVELASNDGYLLRNFVERGVPVLGVDPARGPAKAAVDAGVPTLCDFFDEALARRLVDEGRRADVIIANNVLAHVPNVNGFVSGVCTLLRDDGVAVFETPYVRELVDHCEFDTIYHEHLFYYSLTSLDRLFRSNGLFLNDVRHVAIHGGSLRLFVERVERPSPELTAQLAAEADGGAGTYAFFESFRRRVEHLRDTLRDMLLKLRDDGASLAAYGAAAKGVVLLNYLGVDVDLIEFVVDRNVHKQGLYMPGLRIPVKAPDELLKRAPDYVLLLPWNFRDEILAQQAEYRQRGGKFIIPIPEPEIV